MKQLAYPAIEPGLPHLIVERVEPLDVTLEFSASFLRLAQEAYTPVLADTEIPPHAVETAYRDNESNVIDRHEILLSDIKNHDAMYWVVRDPKSPQRLLGMAGVLLYGANTVYLSDVMAVPPWRRGVGSRLLHASLAHSGLDPDAIVQLDALEGSSAAAWYQKRGFEPTVAHSSIRIGGHRIPTRTYTTPAAVAVRGAIECLEQRMPALLQAEVLSFEASGDSLSGMGGGEELRSTSDQLTDYINRLTAGFSASLPAPEVREQM